MAAAKTTSPTNCPSCGARNAPSAPGSRCASCGAPMDPLGPPARGAAAALQGRGPRGGFSVVWCGVALVVQTVLTAALVIGLPMVVTALDFEGSSGMTIAIPVWFVGGL